MPKQSKCSGRERVQVSPMVDLDAKASGWLAEHDVLSQEAGWYWDAGMDMVAMYLEGEALALRPSTFDESPPI